MIPIRNTLRSIFLSGYGGLINRLTPGVHVLNGHALSVRDINTSSEVFDSRLKALKNYADFVDIQDAVNVLREGRKQKDVYIAFTFDDGYLECYTGIAPVLEGHGVNAAFFVNPGFVDGDESYRRAFFLDKTPDILPRLPMTREMLRDLAIRNFVIGAHTVDHVRLVGLSKSMLEAQVRGCRTKIEEITGISCEHFAWTYGKFKDIDQDALEIALDTYPFVYSSDNYCEAMSLNGKVINRRHFECDWPVSHVKYFLSRARD